MQAASIVSLALAFLAGVLVSALFALWRGWRPFGTNGPRQAQLLNEAGRLDSVRTVIGPPPARIVCRAGVYARDRRATGDHLVYRRQA